MGDPLKVTVLYDVWGEEDTSEPEATQAGRKRKVKEDREEIFDALSKLGHEPSYYVLDGRPQSLYGLGKCGADLVFNLTESYAGDDTKEMNVSAYMDLLGLRLHRRGAARAFSCAGQSYREKDVRLPPDSHAFFRDCLSRKHRSCARR